MKRLLNQVGDLVLKAVGKYDYSACRCSIVIINENSWLVIRCKNHTSETMSASIGNVKMERKGNSLFVESPL